MTAESETNEILDPVLRTFRRTLQLTLEAQLVEIYISGSVQMMEWAGRPYEGPPIRQAIDYAQSRGARLVTQMDDVTRDRLARIVSEGIENRRGVPGLARDLRHEFGDMIMNRSRVIARTESCDALEQAFMDRAVELEISGKEWVVADPCPICAENGDAGVIPINDTFPSGHIRPPAHPNAVFAGYVFSPYGSLQQMLRSRYDGPAISLEAERFNNSSKLASGDTTYISDVLHRDIMGKKNCGSSNLAIRDRSAGLVAIFPQRIQLTIGPNHPILTRRGFIDAQFLNEGDELLYDTGSEFTASGVTPDFKQVYSIESIFESMGSLFGYMSIPTAKDYFHGDESFCYGEIQVIRPQRDLLSIGNSSIIEHLSKCNLTEAYANAEHVASCSSCQFRFNGIFHSPPSNMCCFCISSIHKTSFSGWAFDASTTTELYNIGGVVVKNCQCALAPARVA